jgi:hypothetical protein
MQGSFPVSGSFWTFFLGIDVLVPDMFLVKKVELRVDIVDSKLLNKFVITNFVLKVPLVERNKICLIVEISLKIPTLVKPVSYALV